jgi:hypothetical protein
VEEGGEEAAAGGEEAREGHGVGSGIGGIWSVRRRKGKGVAGMVGCRSACCARHGTRRRGPRRDGVVWSAAAPSEVSVRFGETGRGICFMLEERCFWRILILHAENL